MPTLRECPHTDDLNNTPYMISLSLSTSIHFISVVEDTLLIATGFQYGINKDKAMLQNLFVRWEISVNN